MSEPITPEQTRAARALLAWSQRQLAAEAQISPSTLADFERGSRTPVANNAKAIRAALEAQGLQFIAGGVVEKTRLPGQAPRLKPGTLVRWIDATSLSQWSERRDGQSGMPELIRRLINVTVGPAAQVRFPYDENVQHSGWDGVCTSPIGIGLVPEGPSVWEIGTQKRSIAAKADEEYKKRTENPLGATPEESTFIFVTSRPFPNKEGWAAGKQAERIWKDVRVIDVNQLVHWLESYPGVALWLAVKIGRRPSGLRDLEEVWAEWSRATAPPITPALLLEDRDEEATTVRKWLMEPPTLMSVQAESPDEAVAFLYATLDHLPLDHRRSHLSRCVVVPSNGVARELLGNGSPLVIVLAEPDPGLAQRLVDDGHHVYAPHGPEGNASPGLVRLSRPWSRNIQTALLSAGLREEDAHRLARASGRSVTVLRRLTPSAPGSTPKWVSTAPIELVAAMLAGGWVESSEIDRQVVSKLAGRSYEELERVLVPLTASLDAPIRRSAGVWRVTSLRDLWILLAPRLTPTLLNRLEEAFLKVMSVPDPRFDFSGKQLFFEKPNQFPPEASSALRQGLTETLIALGVYPEAVPSVGDPGSYADTAVRKLLSAADARLWWSLSRDFRRLAEASPKEFLSGVEKGIEGKNPPIMSLFRSDEGILSQTEYLSELLWALEMLARSRDYLMPSALLLAKLAEVDPGGKIGNRPGPSLREIFVPWFPQTYASAEERFKVIDAILKRHPEVGWHLLVGIAPKFHDMVTPTPLPDWRDFAPDQQQEVNLPTVQRATLEVGKRLLAHVGGSIERWKTLLDHWTSFEVTWREQAINLLRDFVRGLEDQIEIEDLRDHLRDLLQKHRDYSDADWAMPEEDLTPLDEIFHSLQPSGVEERNRWLFKTNGRIMRRHVPWQQAMEEQAAARRNAATELMAALSDEDLLKYSATLNLAFEFGQAIAQVRGTLDAVKGLLEASLTSTDSSEFNLGWGLLAGLIDVNGVQVLDAVWTEAIESGWGEKAELLIVQMLPVQPATWARVDARSSALAQRYWESLNVYRIQKGEDLPQVVERLLHVQRGRAAVHMLGAHIEENPASSILIEALKAAAKDESVDSLNDAAMFQHYLAKILGKLESDPSVDVNEIASLEWIFFEALRYSERRPRALMRGLAENPEFFVQLLKLLYPPEEGSGVEEPASYNPDQTRGLASHAYHVLADWNRVPGSDDQGQIHGPTLEAWVKRARKLCEEAGRTDVGELCIGKILSAAVRHQGEPWPPEPVREIIELVHSRALEEGFETGTYNRRGVTTRSPFDGGDLERGLSAIYRRDAEALKFDWPHTAACLQRLAETYDREARMHDQEMEQRD